MENKNTYVGHRYVPKIIGEHDKSISYEGLSIVTYQGTSYTSKKRVPIGVDINNEEYWVVTGNYNAQIEEYRQEVKDLKRDTTNEISNISTQVLENDTNIKEINETIGDYGKRNFLNNDNSNMFERSRINALTGQQYTDMQYTSSDFNEIIPNKEYLIYSLAGKELANVGVIFYTNDKVFIEGQSQYFDGKNTEIEFETPTNAYYFKITARTDSYFNDTRLEEFKIQLGTVKETDFKSELSKLKHRFVNFQNNDDAITKLINTGLTYAKSDELEYGNDFTPYSYKVEKNSNGYYELDCSSFTQVCLQGITMENSRYFHSDNYSDNFNYPLYSPTSSHGRMLANNIAKYAYENGLTFEANDDFSNVKPGDMFFHYNASSKDINFWRSIGHNGFIVDINGTNKQRPHFDVLECGGKVGEFSPENNPVSINRYTYDEFVRVKRTYLFARFPMQNISNQTKDITLEYDTQTRDIKTIEPLQENKIYTAFVKLKNRNGKHPIISVNNKNLVSGFNQSYAELDEILYRLVFYIPTGTLTNQNDFIVIKLGDNSSEVVIDYKSLYEGFVTTPNDYN